LFLKIKSSSIHPLKTQPNLPSPTTLSGRKFLVAVFSSLKLKLFMFEDFKISPSVRGVGGMEGVETLLLKQSYMQQTNQTNTA